MEVQFHRALPAIATGRRFWMLALALVISTVAPAELGGSPLVRTSPSRAKGYSLSSWQSDDGLPQMTPTALTQSRDGFLWVGTFNGLARFDGVRFTCFNSRNTPAFSSEHITCLFEDQSGTLWIGTGEGGLLKYSGDRFHAVPGPGSFTRLRVRAICADGKGVLWVGTSAGLCQVVQDRLQLTTKESSLVGREVLSVFRGLEDDLWIGTHRDIRRLSAAGRLEAPILSPKNVRHWARDAGGRIWASFVEGNLATAEPGAQMVRPTLPRARFKVDAMDFGRDGVLRMGTLTGELYEAARAGSNGFLPQATFGGGVTALYQDRDENLWVGLEAQGLWCLRKSAFVTLGSEHGLPAKPVTSICEDRLGRIWAGTFGEALRLWDGARFVAVASAEVPAQVSSLLADREGTLWFGTYGGKLARRSDTGVFEYEPTFGNHCRTLFQDRDGGIWAGRFLDGLDYMSEEGTVRYREADGLSNEMIQAIAQDHTGDMWIGTAKGLNRIHEGSVEQFFRKDGLAGENVRALFVDSEGTLWIGSTGGGLTRGKGGARGDARFLRSIGVEQGLINEGIEQIIEDDHGYLWLGSDAGLMRADLKELNDCVSGRRSFIHCMVFRRERGTPPGFGTGFQPSCFKAPDGKLWFATGSGIVLIDPAEIRSDLAPPPIYLEELRADKDVFTFGSAHQQIIAVPAGTRRLEFRYTGIDFQAPELMQFRYKLDGFDPEWVNAGTRREAVYTSIPPGKYRFRVAAANNQGVWNENGATAAFLIQPFFWQTPLFQWAAPALGLLAFGAAARAFLLRNHRRELALLRQKHALECERARIAQDMHDGLGSSLVKISLLGEQAERRLAAADHARPQVRKMIVAARQVVREMDEIVWAVNPKNDTLENFAGYLCAFAREHFCDTPVECHLDFPAELPHEVLSAEVRHNLFLAVREALNNVVKHAQAQRVWMRMQISGAKFEIEVRDDGNGFPTDLTAPRNGLSNMRARLRQLGGAMRLQSSSGGTTVQFIVSFGP